MWLGVISDPFRFVSLLLYNISNFAWTIHLFMWSWIFRSNCLHANYVIRFTRYYVTFAYLKCQEYHFTYLFTGTFALVFIDYLSHVRLYDTVFYSVSYRYLVIMSFSCFQSVSFFFLLAHFVNKNTLFVSWSCRVRCFSCFTRSRISHNPINLRSLKCRLMLTLKHGSAPTSQTKPPIYQARLDVIACIAIRWR